MEVGFSMGLGIMGKSMSMNILKNGFKVTFTNKLSEIRSFFFEFRVLLQYTILSLRYAVQLIDKTVVLVAKPYYLRPEFVKMSLFPHP
ncbi:unnamed protein product [Arabidopsis thaliana]|uniref:6-phosphogluconate dehydrogenase NADP-binding domain-containing protein n=1 Tax=Arabidopsis thaliana TaxID=3702 RepID=A0A654F2M2_ARATH|nr:unnamed protein product [Arabidopsis thaliana]